MPNTAAARRDILVSNRAVHRTSTRRPAQPEALLVSAASAAAGQATGWADGAQAKPHRGICLHKTHVAAAFYVHARNTGWS